MIISVVFDCTARYRLLVYYGNSDFHVIVRNYLFELALRIEKAPLCGTW